MADDALTRKEAEMGRLTPRTDAFSNPSTEGDHDAFVTVETYNTLLEHACKIERELSALSLESVREEALENVLEIAGMLEFQAKLALDHGETDIKLDAATIVPKIVESLRALQHAPARVAEEQPGEQKLGQGWIPASERLPEKDGTFLTLLEGDVVAELDKRCWYCGKWVYMDGSESDLPVTHWMPLPEPPK